MATSSNGSDARKACTNNVANKDESNAKGADANIAATANEPAKRKADGNTRRADANVAATASESTKKRADAKIVATANETATAYINEPANNAKRAHANGMVTADVNVTAATNKATSKARKRVPMYQQPQIPI